MKADVVLANPAPLGLLGFGMTTILLNLANANLYGLSSTVAAMGIFYGGIAQIVAGLLEFRKGNTFGMVAFLSYGFFWETFVFIVLALTNTWGLGALAPSNTALGYYLFFWGLFTLMMFIGTLRINGALMGVFGTLWILFFLLAAGAWTNAAPTSALAIGTGYEGVLCGLLAFYTAAANILNEVYGRSVLPLWPVKPKM
jgi:succinate-acetate transporter protein